MGIDPRLNRNNYNFDTPNSSVSQINPPHMKTTVRKTYVRLTTRLNIFKCLVAGCALLFLLPSAKAQFTNWPVYEPFGEYLEGEDLGTNGDSGIYWDVGNGGTNGVSSFIITGTAAMSYPALVADTNSDPKGVMSQYQPNSSADRGFIFPTNTLGTGAIYASFLLNYIDNGAATAFPYDRACFNLVTGATDESGGSFGAIYSSVWMTADYRLKINKNWQQGGTATFSSTTAVIATNVPHLIVVRYLVKTGGNDEMDLWLDPTPFGNDGSVPPPTLTTTNGSNIASFNAVILNNRKSSPPTAPLIPTAHVFYVDEIRLGDTFSEVTPLATAVPGPTFTVTGGGTTCPSSPPDVALSGSVSTNVYLLYTNEVFSGISLPGTGSALDFGLQSAQGVYSVLASNTATADIGWMSNSVTVTLIQPPNIVIEPNPVVTATNNRAEFTVSSSGSGLGYQWYQDGTPLVNSTSITGAQSNDLVISPATVANIGNYYCIITNSCGLSSTTTTNSLSLDSPNQLLWVGDQFSINVWALANTNYNFDLQDTNGNPAVFNGGDNITFDDTYPYANPVTLTNTLTPSSITMNGTRNYIFGGKGIIAGSGGLLMNSSGVLSLSNDTSGTFSNNFSGGTVISNGTINISASWTSLGSGPVTLAGGTLESFQKGSGTGTSSSSGMVNNLSITANSTWLIDRTGNQCAGLVGALLGNPGTTLFVTNSAVTSNSLNTIRFGGVFTNFSAIITAVNPITSNSQMTLATFHPSGVEVYNGAISGPTAAFQVSGAGSVYLNGANTYTNLTTVSAGLLAGSGSIAGNLTNASGGTIGGGPASGIGTFSISGNVTNAGKVFIRVNKSLAQSNDLISVSGVITNNGTGTVTITNIGASALAVGDRFQIFSEAVENGAALKVTGGGLTWANNLAVDGSVQVALDHVVLTNSPKITSFSLQSTNAVFGGTNGQAGATAFLLTTTNLAAPLSQWQTVSTDILGGSGFTFTATNAVNASAPQQFFLLSSTNYNP